MYYASNYLRKVIDRYPVLSNDKQRKLIEKAQCGDEEAIDLLFYSNLRLLIVIIKRLGVPPNYELDDLIAAGAQGIMYAIDRFDLKSNVKVSAFFGQAAEWHIIKFKRASFHDHDSLNVLAYGEDSDSDVELLELVPCHNSEKIISETDAGADLCSLLRYLNEREQIVIILLNGIFGFYQYGMESIASALGVSAGRICAMNRVCMKKLQGIATGKIKEADTYDLITLDKIQELIDSKELVSKSELQLSKLDIGETVLHNYTFKQGVSAVGFQEEFGDQIRSDYLGGLSTSKLESKYNCPNSQIKKALKGIPLRGRRSKVGCKT